MLINENIGAVISNADTIEIKFSDNDGLDKNHINKNNDRESEEKINENRKEELDYYIREAFSQNIGQGEGFDRDFSEKYYSEDEYTDQTVREMCEEIIRGKALKLLNQEIPHGLYVEIESFKESKTKKGEDIVNIETVIYTKKSTHKGIIVGKNGEMLKRIGSYARADIERMLEKKVNLQIWVKVRKNWLDNDLFLNRFKKK